MDNKTIHLSRKDRNEKQSLIEFSPWTNNYKLTQGLLLKDWRMTLTKKYTKVKQNVKQNDVCKLVGACVIF